MALFRWNRNTLWRNLVIGVLSVGLCMGGTAWAGPRGHRSGPYPEPGKIHGRIPPGHQVVHVGHDRYAYHEGVFYHRVPKGYKVVRPPRGAVVRHLPRGYRTVVIAGGTYFLFAGVHYRKGPAGYVVVEVPREDCGRDDFRQDADGQLLAVAVHRLNVRSGPGRQHPVIDRLYHGERLVMVGSSPDWFYVRLPGGNFGWVMARHTHFIESRAKG